MLNLFIVSYLFFPFVFATAPLEKNNSTRGEQVMFATRFNRSFWINAKLLAESVAEQIKSTGKIPQSTDIQKLQTSLYNFGMNEYSSFLSASLNESEAKKIIEYSKNPAMKKYFELVNTNRVRLVFQTLAQKSSVEMLRLKANAK